MKKTEVGNPLQPQNPFMLNRRNKMATLEFKDRDTTEKLAKRVSKYAEQRKRKIKNNQTNEPGPEPQVHDSQFFN